MITQRSMKQRLAECLRFVETMDSLVLVNFMVPVERVQRHLPPGLQAETYQIDGAKQAFVSLVCYQAVGFRPALFRGNERLGLSVQGINYRAYVRDPVGSAVFFFGVTTNQRLPYLASTLMGSRTYHAPVTFDDAWDAGRLRLHSPHPWPVTLDARDTGAPLSLLPPFESAVAMRQALTDPLCGYVRGTYGGLGRLEVHHLAMEHATPGDVSYVQSGLLEQLGIVHAGERSHSLIIARNVRFRLWLGWGIRGKAEGSRRKGGRAYVVKP